MNRRGFFGAACGVVLGLLGVKAAKAKPPVVGVDFSGSRHIAWRNYTFEYSPLARQQFYAGSIDATGRWRVRAWEGDR